MVAGIFVLGYVIKLKMHEWSFILSLFISKSFFYLLFIQIYSQI
jgi:hypothetical protein